MALQEIAQGKDTLRSNDPGTVRVLGAGDVKMDLRPAPRELNNALLLKVRTHALNTMITKRIHLNHLIWTCTPPFLVSSSVLSRHTVLHNGIVSRPRAS